jgi:hypothetical protein
LSFIFWTWAAIRFALPAIWSPFFVRVNFQLDWTQMIFSFPLLPSILNRTWCGFISEVIV